MTLSSLSKTITACNDCSRLRSYCRRVAEVKKKAYLQEEYWGKPISGFGDPQARLMIVGLAPAAHGANRTGRIFTGDRSGDWLYRALYKTQFANQPTSTDRSDGLSLNDVYITCVVKCAPPDNKPAPIETKTCIRYLKTEIEILRKVQVWIALGHFSLNSLWPLLQPDKSRPKFQHGAEIQLGKNRTLLLSYHPSQQNTFTGRLTEPMFDSVFERARFLIA